MATIPGTSVGDASTGNDSPDLLYGFATSTLDSAGGTQDNDSLSGEGGDDRIWGNGGNDLLGGGAGNDSLTGGDGNDILEGGAGADSLAGGGGNDTASYAGAGAGVTVDLGLSVQGAAQAGDAAGDRFVSIEAVLGSAWNDRITAASTGSATLDGAGGDDLLVGLLGSDRLLGGAGDDTLYIGGGEAVDTAEGGSGNDLILQGSRSATGGFVDDGPPGAALLGGAGDDTIVAGQFAATIDGGEEEGDSDWLDYGQSANTNAVTVDLRTGNPIGGPAGSDRIVGVSGNSSIENVIGTAGNDRITGDDQANRLVGGAGGDSLDGGLGDDTLTGGAGADTLAGGDGFDVASYRSQALTVGVSVDLGIARQSGGEAQNDSLTGIEGVEGSSASDTLRGADATGNLLSGLEGNDVLEGKGGDDTLLGGTGGDLLDGGAGNDSLTGGIGSDTIVTGDGADLVVFSGDLSAYTIAFGGTDGIGSFWNVTGGPDASDRVYANAGDIFQFSDSTFAICFYPGTRIATPAGERAIETLSAGDLVLTKDGAAAPIRWVGRQTVSTRFADPLRVLPIRIRAGALGDGLPTRDLLLSPAHALLLDGVLVNAGALVNGSTITREAAVPEVFTYYNLELAEHALILAEGTPAETFVDNVSREHFDNWAEHEALVGDAPIEEMDLPRAMSHRQVPMAIRRRLAEIAARLTGATQAA